MKFSALFLIILMASKAFSMTRYKLTDFSKNHIEERILEVLNNGASELQKPLYEDLEILKVKEAPINFFNQWDYLHENMMIDQYYFYTDLKLTINSNEEKLLENCSMNFDSVTRSLLIYKCSIDGKTMDSLGVSESAINSFSMENKHGEYVHQYYFFVVSLR